MTALQTLLDVLINASPDAQINLETLHAYATDLGDKTAARRVKALIYHVKVEPPLHPIPDRQLQFLNDIYRQLITTFAILTRLSILNPAADLATEHEYHIIAINTRAAQLAESLTP